MNLRTEDYMQKILHENEALIEVSQFTKINTELKIVNISERILEQLNWKQRAYLLELKKIKYSLQYTIE